VLSRDEYLKRAAAAEELLRKREREIGFKVGPKAAISLLDIPEEGRSSVSFVEGEQLRLVCLRALTALPLAVEDVVLGVRSADFFDYPEDEIRAETIELLARYWYASEIDFLGNDPPRHMLPVALLEGELANRRPETSRRRQSALAG
jgi:hypothetical protein